MIFSMHYIFMSFLCPSVERYFLPTRLSRGRDFGIFCQKNVKIPTLALTGCCNSCDASGGKEMEPLLIAVSLMNCSLPPPTYPAPHQSKFLFIFRAATMACLFLFVYLSFIYLFVYLFIYLFLLCYLLLVIPLFNFIYFFHNYYNNFFLMFRNVLGCSVFLVLSTAFENFFYAKK